MSETRMREILEWGLKDAEAAWPNSAERTYQILIAAINDALAALNSPSPPEAEDAGEYVVCSGEKVSFEDIRKLYNEVHHWRKLLRGWATWKGLKGPGDMREVEYFDKIFMPRMEPLAPPEDAHKAGGERHGWTVHQGVTCVECPDCAFMMDAEHEDTDSALGGYTCPNCSAAATGERGERYEGWAVEDFQGVQFFGTDRAKVKERGDHHAIYHSDWEVYLRRVTVTVHEVECLAPASPGHSEGQNPEKTASVNDEVGDTSPDSGEENNGGQ